MNLLERVAVAAGVAVRSEPATVEPTAPLGGPTPAAIMPPTRDLTGGIVTPRDALSLDAVFRAVQILQTAGLQLTVDVWRGTDLIPRPRIADTPDAFDTGGAFWADTISSLALRGNAYWRKTSGSAGTVINLEVLDPLEVLPYRDTRGRTRYAHNGDDLTRADIQHLKLLRLPREVLGLGPIQAVQRGLRGALDVAQYGSTWFTSSEVPSGILTTDQALTSEQAKAYKAAWQESRTAHDTAVLGGGVKYEHLHLTPSEVQWLDSQRFNVAAIARLFGIPSRQLLVAIEGGSTTYANAEQEDISFVRYTLMAYLREIELALTAILPGTQTARFNVDALLRTDTKTRYEAHAIAIEAGFLTTDEVRAIEGLPATSSTPTPAPAQEIPA